MHFNKISSLISVILLLFLLSCTAETDDAATEQAENDEQEWYGEAFTPAAYRTVDELIPDISTEERGPFQVKGEIVQVCQSKGCWLTLVSENEAQVRVTFKDYDFFVPKDAAGRTVVMEGITWYDEVSVDHLRHYAEDAGDSQEDIDAITEPKYSYYFEATGVLFL